MAVDEAPVNATATTRSGDVEERLLVAALPLFGRRGFTDVSVREVARAAGVTTPTVYYYFGNKRGLYLRLLHDLLERRATAMRTALSSKGDPITRLRRVLEAYVWLDRRDAVDKEVHLFMLRETFGLGADLFPDLISEHDASNRRVVRTLLQEGIGTGIFRPVRVEHTAIAIIGVMSTFIRRAALGANVRPADGIAQVMDVVIEGLRPRQPAEASDGNVAAGIGRRTGRGSVRAARTRAATSVVGD